MGGIDIITFGCRLNAYESEVIRRAAGEAGLRNAVIVNTCAVTAEAERQARQAIRRARREHDRATISQHYDEDSEFFLTFLDRRHRCYTEGVFACDDEPLEDAMTRKMDLAIDALARREPPPDPSRAASPEAKRLIAFHQCLAAVPARNCAGAMR